MPEGKTENAPKCFACPLIGAQKKGRKSSRKRFARHLPLLLRMSRGRSVTLVKRELHVKEENINHHVIENSALSLGVKTEPKGGRQHYPKQNRVNKVRVKLA